MADIIIPESLKALRAANLKPNPVNIAGYGRESTHKGYLSWILDSDRNLKAIELATLLLHGAAGNWRKPYLGSEHNPLSFRRVWATTEERVGKHFIDLMLHFDSEDREYTLGVEIKGDAGPSSKEQFAAMYAALENDPHCLGAIVLLLGTSSLFRTDLVFDLFEPIRFEDIFYKWNERIFAGTQLSLGYSSGGNRDTPRFLLDWMEAIGMEIARKRLAHEAYLEIRAQVGLSHKELGFRLARHPIMYTYPLIQSALENNRKDWYWIAENSTKNAVLGCGFKHGLKDFGFFVPIPEVPGISWFYEFNDDCFHLKIKNESSEIGQVYAWINSTKRRIEALDSPPTLEFTKTRIKAAMWMTVAKWSIDWKDIQKAAKDVVILTERLESNILGKPVKNGGA